MRVRVPCNLVRGAGARHHQDEHERLRALDRDRLAREDELALHIGDARVKEQDDIVEHRGSPVQERAVVAEGRVQLDKVGCKK